MAPVRLSVARTLLVALVVAVTGIATMGPAQAIGSERGPGGAVGAPTLPAAGVSNGPKVQATTSAANDRIAGLVPDRLTNAVLGSRVAVRVYDPSSGATVFTRRSTESFRVASNTKLVTAASALHAMGPSRTFPTTVMLGRGNHVYIVGGGDPLLSSSNLRSLAAKAASALKARGITRAVVHLDESLFEPWSFPSGFTTRCPESHGSRGYCITPVHALTYDRRSTSDNGKAAASYFAGRLNAAAGLSASYAGRSEVPTSVIGVGGPTGAAGPTVLARYGGHRLDVMIRAMLFPSDDEIAETLFRHIAVATGHAASMSGARNAQREVLANLGVPLGGVVISSGSGRSQDDRFTAAAMIKLLSVAIDGKHSKMAALRNGTSATGGLPLMMRAGVDGTLHTSFGRYSSSPSSCARGLVYAKTGTLGDAIALSGYAKGSDGKWRVFSILVNNRPTAYSSLTTRQHVDRIAATVTGCY